jgi:hypothetical protein
VELAYGTPGFREHGLAAWLSRADGGVPVYELLRTRCRRWAAKGGEARDGRQMGSQNLSKAARVRLRRRGSLVSASERVSARARWLQQRCSSAAGGRWELPLKAGALAGGGRDSPAREGAMGDGCW